MGMRILSEFAVQECPGISLVREAPFLTFISYQVRLPLLRIHLKGSQGVSLERHTLSLCS